MGRITIFSLDECPHCIRTKEAFKQRQHTIRRNLFI